MTWAQQKVVRGASLNLRANHPDYRGGVCLDEFPSDEECQKDHNECVKDVVVRTEVWEGLR